MKALQRPGLLQNRPHDDCSRLPQQLLLSSFLTGMVNNVVFKLLHGGLMSLLNKYHKNSIFRLNDLSASNDVSIIFQGYIEEKTQKFLIFKVHRYFVYHSSTSVIPPTK